jgi:hypothetical protein
VEDSLKIGLRSMRGLLRYFSRSNATGALLSDGLHGLKER